MRALRTLDRRLFARVAESRLRGAHPVLPRLSTAANHGVLWLGAAAVLAASGSRTARRAALRGVGSLALASLVANLPAKSATRRPRPLLDTVPLARRLRVQPLTSSFPSGHSASAAAFTVGVALESPALALCVAPVALGVMASRVYVGVHYPGDVLAGAAFGAGAALLTTRWWPRAAEAPAQAAPPQVHAPALPRGAGLVVVVNADSGPDGPDTAVAELRRLLPDADLVLRGPGDDLPALVEEAARRAAADGGALGVCGGDGSVNLAADAARRAGLPLAVFPGGTLNHFALDLGTASLAGTASAVEDGSAVSVDIGRAQGPDGTDLHFLNTFSIGVYPDLVRIRERHEKRIGKWPALGVALVEVLSRAEPVRVSVSGVPRSLWLLFAGSGAYDPPGFAPTRRVRLDDGILDVRIVDGSHPFARTRLVLAFLTGTLGRSPVYKEARLRALDVSDLRGVPHAAIDGEVVDAPDRLLLGKRPGGLTVYRPHPAGAGGA
ncbi:bifunctional phosphatase PAP2/diacylglycerol kinase family protein [Kitasatospora sp. NBC_01539]|uniref:bifunctional phosphatase PAP2/diacylglycerol kinase family protein n=1 Tax=Kitasatospora sp. NBC_01539 TaxID=2903577 RepID=UPI0038603264